MRRVVRLAVAGMGIAAGLATSAPSAWATVPLEAQPACGVHSSADRCDSTPQHPRPVAGEDADSWRVLIQDCLLTGSKSPNPWVYCPPFGKIPPGGI